ncbi:MAG: hypothetical protein ABH843_00175, partial [Candidatus Omnitrophota bacterium]
MEPGHSKIKNLFFSNGSYIYKAICWTIIITFTWQQLAYGIDLSDLDRRSQDYISKQGFSAIDYLREKKQEQELLKNRMLLENKRGYMEEFASRQFARNAFINLFTSYQAIASLLQQIDKARNLAYRASTTYVLFNPDASGIQKRIEFFGGNVTAVWNERVEEGGMVFYRNTYEMKYNERNLLVEYTSTTTDAYGVVTEIHWYDAEYTADSLWYADDTTNARKALVSYRVDTRVYGSADGEVIEVDNLTHIIKDQEYYEDGEFAGMLSGYTEEVYDEEGNLIETRYISQIAYEGEGEQSSYYRIVRDVNENIIEEGWVYVAEEGVVTGAVSVIIRHRIFDDEDNMVGFTEEYKNEDGEVIQSRTRSNMQYGADGNLVSFHERMEDAKGTAIYEGDFIVDSILVISTDPECKRMQATGQVFIGEDLVTYTIDETRYVNAELTGDITTIENPDGSTDVVSYVYDENKHLIMQEYKKTYADGTILHTITEYKYDGADRIILSKSTRTRYPAYGLATTTVYENERDYDADGNIVYSRYRTTDDDGSWRETQSMRTLEDGYLVSEIEQRLEHSSGMAEGEFVIGRFSLTARDYYDGKIITKQTTTVDEDGSIKDSTVSYEYDGEDILIDSVTGINYYASSVSLIDELRGIEISQIADLGIYITGFRASVSNEIYGSFSKATLTRTLNLYEGLGDERRLKETIRININDDGTVTRKITSYAYDEEGRIADRVVREYEYEEASDPEALANYLRDYESDVDTAPYGVLSTQELSRRSYVYGPENRIESAVTVDLESDGSATKRVSLYTYDEEEKITDRVTVVYKYGQASDIDSLIGYLNNTSNNIDNAPYGLLDSQDLSRTSYVYGPEKRIDATITVTVSEDGSAVKTVSANTYDAEGRIVDSIKTTYEYEEASDVQGLMNYLQESSNDLSQAPYGTLSTQRLSRKVYEYGADNRITSVVAVEVERNGLAKKTVSSYSYDGEGKITARITAIYSYEEAQDIEALITYLNDAANDVYAAPYGTLEGQTLNRTDYIYDSENRITLTVTVKVSEDGSAVKTVSANTYDAEGRIVDRITTIYKYEEASDAQALLVYLDDSSNSIDSAPYGILDGQSLTRTVYIYGENNRIDSTVTVRVNQDGSCVRTVTTLGYNEAGILITRVREAFEYKEIEDPSLLIDYLKNSALLTDSAPYGELERRTVNETSNRYDLLGRLVYTLTENTTYTGTGSVISYTYSASTRDYYINGRLKSKLDTYTYEDGSLRQMFSSYAEDGTKTVDRTEDVKTDGTKILLERDYVYKEGKKVGQVLTTTKIDAFGEVELKTEEEDAYVYDEEGRLIIITKVFREVDPESGAVITGSEIEVLRQERDYSGEDIVRSYTYSVEKVGDDYAESRYTQTTVLYTDGKIISSLSENHNEDGLLRTEVLYEYIDADINNTTTIVTGRVGSVTNTLREYADGMVIRETVKYSEPVNPDGIRCVVNEFTYGDSRIITHTTSYYTSEEPIDGALAYFDIKENTYDSDNRLKRYETTRYQPGIPAEEQQGQVIGYLEHAEDLLIGDETYTRTIEQNTNLDGTVEFTVTYRNEGGRAIYYIRTVDGQIYDKVQAGFFDADGNLLTIDVSEDGLEATAIDTGINDAEAEEGDIRNVAPSIYTAVYEDEGIKIVYKVTYDEKGNVAHSQNTEIDLETGAEKLLSATENIYNESGEVIRTVRTERKEEVGKGAAEGVIIEFIEIGGEANIERILEYVEVTDIELNPEGRIVSSTITKYSADQATILEVKTTSHAGYGKIETYIEEEYQDGAVSNTKTVANVYQDGRLISVSASDALGKSFAAMYDYDGDFHLISDFTYEVVVAPKIFAADEYTDADDALAGITDDEIDVALGETTDLPEITYEALQEKYDITLGEGFDEIELTLINEVMGSMPADLLTQLRQINFIADDQRKETTIATADNTGVINFFNNLKDLVRRFAVQAANLLEAARRAVSVWVKTLFHEIAHIFDLGKDGDYNQLQRATFQQLSGISGEDLRNYASIYGMTDALEDFATVFEAWCEDSAALVSRGLANIDEAGRGILLEKALVAADILSHQGADGREYTYIFVLGDNGDVTRTEVAIERDANNVIKSIEGIYKRPDEQKVLTGSDELTAAAVSVIEYTRTLTNIYGQVTGSVVVSGFEYDDDGQLMAYSESYDAADGSTVISSISGMEYDELGQLVRFYEERATVRRDTIAFEQRSNRHWYTTEQWYDGKNPSRFMEEGWVEGSGDYRFERYDISYDSNTNPISYKEAGWSQAGGDYTRTWSGSYNEDGSLITYTEVSTDRNGETVKIDWYGAKYSATKGLLGYNKIITSSAGYSTTMDWQGSYNSKGKLSYYKETKQDSATGNSVVTEWTGAYNGLGQLSSFIETITDGLGNQLKRDLSNIQYDELGRQISYQEVDQDQFGEKLHKTWSDAVYNEIGQLLSYKQTVRDKIGNITFTEWLAKAFDEIGRVVGYDEITRLFSDPDITITKHVSDIIYNQHSQTINYSETKITDGTDKSGNVVYLEESVNIEQANSLLDANGDLISYIETRTRQGQDGAGNTVDSMVTTVVDEIEYTNHLKVSYREVITETASPFKSIERSVSGISYNGFNQMISFTQKEHLTDTDGEVNLDTTTATIRTNMVYGASGMLIGYQDEIVYEADEGIVKKAVSSIIYDGLGRLIGNIQTSIDQQGREIKTELKNTRYNLLNQMTGFKEISYQYGDAGAVEVERTRSDMRYLAGELLASYHDKVSYASGGIIEETDWQAGEYYQIGMVKSYAETTRRIGTGIDAVRTTQRFDIEYNRHGQLIEYSEISISADGSTNRSHAQLSDYYMNKARTIVTTYYTPDGMIGNEADIKNTVIQTNIEFDSYDRVSSYDSESWMPDDSQHSFSHAELTDYENGKAGTVKTTKYDASNTIATEESVQDNFRYDLLERTIGYDVVAVSLVDSYLVPLGERTSYTSIEISGFIDGDPASIKTTEFIYGLGGAVKKVSMQEGLEYDRYDRMISYDLSATTYYQAGISEDTFSSMWLAYNGRRSKPSTITTAVYSDSNRDLLRKIDVQEIDVDGGYDIYERLKGYILTTYLIYDEIAVDINNLSVLEADERVVMTYAQVGLQDYTGDKVGSIVTTEYSDSLLTDIKKVDTQSDIAYDEYDRVVSYRLHTELHYGISGAKNSYFETTMKYGPQDASRASGVMNIEYTDSGMDQAKKIDVQDIDTAIAYDEYGRLKEYYLSSYAVYGELIVNTDDLTLLEDEEGVNATYSKVVMDDYTADKAGKVTTIEYSDNSRLNIKKVDIQQNFSYDEYNRVISYDLTSYAVYGMAGDLDAVYASGEASASFFHVELSDYTLDKAGSIATTEFNGFIGGNTKKIDTQSNFSYDEYDRATGYDLTSQAYYGGAEEKTSYFNVVLSDYTLAKAGAIETTEYSDFIGGNIKKIDTQTDFSYDEYERVLSYSLTTRTIYGVEGDRATYFKVSLSDYTLDKAARVTTTEYRDAFMVDLKKTETQSNLIYDEYGRVAGYSLTSQEFYEGIASEISYFSISLSDYTVDQAGKIVTTEKLGSLSGAIRKIDTQTNFSYDEYNRVTGYDLTSQAYYEDTEEKASYFRVVLSDYTLTRAGTIVTTEYRDFVGGDIKKIDTQTDFGYDEYERVLNYELTTTKYKDGVAQDPSYFFVEMRDYVGDDAHTIETTEYDDAARTIIVKIDLQENITRDSSDNITSYKLTTTKYESGIAQEPAWFFVELSDYVGENAKTIKTTEYEDEARS